MDATPYLLVQLSDPHITHPGRLISGRVDTAACLRQAVDRLLQLRPRPVAVLISGDLVDAGHPAEYAQLRELLEPFFPISQQGGLEGGMAFRGGSRIGGGFGQSRSHNNPGALGQRP